MSSPSKSWKNEEERSREHKVRTATAAALTTPRSLNYSTSNPHRLCKSQILFSPYQQGNRGQSHCPRQGLEPRPIYSEARGNQTAPPRQQGLRDLWQQS